MASSAVTGAIQTQTPPPGPLPKCDSVQALVSLVSGTTPPLQPPHSLPTPPPEPTIHAVNTDGQSQPFQISAGQLTLSLSARALHSVCLRALAPSPSAPSHTASTLREVSLAANMLSTIDLQPLSSCYALTVLTLNSNRITSIDLTPLASCHRLERLWLHDNRLRHVNLKPLETCSNLRSLYLEDNSIHDLVLDLSPLQTARQLRSLRLGGNRLAGHLDVTPLLAFPSLSVFNVDAAVTLVADADPSSARSSPALRRFARDIRFNTPVPPSLQTSVKSRSVQQSASLSSSTSTSPNQRPSRRRVSPPASAPPKHFESLPPSSTNSSSSPSPRSLNTVSTPIIVMLVGFRRLARYSAEDAFARCGKVVIRASSHNVATTEPALLRQSHLILVYAPSEKVVRQISAVATCIPIVIIATERYRSTADHHLLDVLERHKFYLDPLQTNDAKLLYDMGTRFINDEHAITQSVCSATHASDISKVHQSQIMSQKQDVTEKNVSIVRNFVSESDLPTSLTCGSIEIELEHIEDEDTDAMSTSTEPSCAQNGDARQDSRNLKVTDESEVSRRLSLLRAHHLGRHHWGKTESGNRLSVYHNDQKLHLERRAIEATFTELGGSASSENSLDIARLCGLAKCVGPLLFFAAFGLSCEIEATTPEAGVPNTPALRKKRISMDTFIAYWEARLRLYDAEERLSHVLEDSYIARARTAAVPGNVGYSVYGALQQRTRSDSPSRDDGCGQLVTNNPGRPVGGNRGTLNDFTCPCDAGIEELVRSFMESRTGRFGSYALVKLPEAVAIGASLLLLELRGGRRGRVGGISRPVCPREVREARLNAALCVAETGVFEGVVGGLSMGHIRAVKACFSTEVTHEMPCRSPPRGGSAISWTLRVEDVQRFCTSRKTLLPMVVRHVIRAHCRNPNAMSIGEFAVLLAILSDLESDAAVDFFFTVGDVDRDERWTPHDLMIFHAEKEQMWAKNGMAVTDLHDLWVSMVDMIGAPVSLNKMRNANISNMINRGKPKKTSVSRRDVLALAPKERKIVLQSIFYVDDDFSTVNVRRTLEMNQKSSTDMIVM